MAKRKIQKRLSRKRKNVPKDKKVKKKLKKSSKRLKKSRKTALKPKKSLKKNKKTKKQSKKKSKRPINAFMVAKNKATKTDEKSFTYNGKKYVKIGDKKGFYKCA